MVAFLMEKWNRLHNACMLASDTCTAKPCSLQEVIFLKFAVPLEKCLNSLIHFGNEKLAWISWIFQFQISVICSCGLSFFFFLAFGWVLMGALAPYVGAKAVPQCLWLHMAVHVRILKTAKSLANFMWIFKNPVLGRVKYRTKAIVQVRFLLVQMLEGFQSSLAKKPRALHLCPLSVCVLTLKLCDAFPGIPVPLSAQDRSAS